MLAKLKALFEDKSESDATDLEQRTRLACAALMTEVATIDRNFDETERSALLGILKTQFELSEEDATSLREMALTARDEASSLHQFTRLVHERCSPEEKFELVTNMWKIAHADGHIDKYEEHIIRRAADLLYLGHSDFIRAKLAARNAS